MKNIFEKFHGDGSHCGLTDLYPDHTKALIKALKSGKPFTTGWWASKKEIASAKIDFYGEHIFISVSVTDDFDTNGRGTVSFSVKKGELASSKIDSPIMHKISDGIHKAWEDAEEDEKSNRNWVMYVIGNLKGNKRVDWIETYLIATGDFEEVPSGDNYHKWGFQGESKIPSEVKSSLKKGMDKFQKKVKSKGYIAEISD